MKVARIRVDFNEMLEGDLVLLSKADVKKDSQGNDVHLYEGLNVKIYDCDSNDVNGEDNLIAQGVVELNTSSVNWAKNAKWNCRIDRNGIYNESESIDQTGAKTNE